MKFYFCLDTCTWIYLANGTEPVKFLHDIEFLLNQGRLTILLPEIVLEEWRRNKDKGIIHSPLHSQFTALDKNLKQVSSILDRIETDSPLHFLFEGEKQDTKQEFNEIKDKIEKNKIELLAKVDKNISVIERIFNNSSTIKITSSEKIILDAGRIALEQKAPIHKKNGFADAVIVLSFLDYIKSKNRQKSYFISYNTKDFCQAQELHPDLIPLFEETRSKFYPILGLALKDVDSKLVDDDIIDLIEKNREDYCTECDGYHGFGNEIDFFLPEEILNENSDRYTENESSLFEDDEIESIAVPNLINTIQLGGCTYCSTEYIKCQDCEGIVSIQEYSDDEIFPCDCGIKYKREHEFGRKGEVYTTWCIIDSRTEICAKCDEGFIDKSGTSICEECEEEYNDK